MVNELPENLRYFSEEARALMEGNTRRSFDGGGGGGYDHPMEDRVKNLEKFADEARTELRAIDTRLTKIEAKMDTFATKEDLHKELHGTTWKIMGTFAVLCAAVFWMARNIQPAQSPVGQRIPSSSAPAAVTPQAPAPTK